MHSFTTEEKPLDFEELSSGKNNLKRHFYFCTEK